MTSLADSGIGERQYSESHAWYMIKFLGITLEMYIIGVMKLLTSNFTFNFLLDLN